MNDTSRKLDSAWGNAENPSTLSYVLDPVGEIGFTLSPLTPLPGGPSPAIRPKSDQGGDPERKSARGHVFSSPSWTRVRGFRASGVRVRGFGLRWNDKCIFTSLPKASLKLAQIPMTFTISGRGQPRSSFSSQGPGSSL